MTTECIIDNTYSAPTQVREYHTHITNITYRVYQSNDEIIPYASDKGMLLMGMTISQSALAKDWEDEDDKYWESF